jgi:hypothetical protein
VCSTLKKKHWQLLLQKYRETERRNFPFSGSNSSHLILVVQQELFAKDPDAIIGIGHERERGDNNNSNSRRNRSNLQLYG